VFHQPIIVEGEKSQEIRREATEVLCGTAIGVRGGYKREHRSKNELRLFQRKLGADTCKRKGENLRQI